MDQPGHNRDEHGQVWRIRVVHADAEIADDVEADYNAVQDQDQPGRDAAKEDRRITIGPQPHDRADEAADKQRDAAPPNDEVDERVGD